MARKSRKNAQAVAEVSTAEMTVFNTAIYVRLSVENSGKDDDGDSIENQIAICKSYVEERPYLKLHGIFQDNGAKGTNFDRPEFNRLMDLLRAGKINCIVVKDLSRFGRYYIETGNFLEKIFPFLGVRFIAITDNFDSFNTDGTEESLMIPLKNMINELYAKDISRKIITSFRARQERGEFLPAFVPYGYIKSKTEAYQLEIDEEVADNVRLIFRLKAEGLTHGEICRQLNEMGATTPAMRKVQLGLWKAEKYKRTVWYGRTLIDILKNPYYTGCLPYGRMPKSLYEGVKVHRAPREEWRIIPNHHEAIIDQETFDKVQKMFDDNSERYKQKLAESKDDRDKIVNLFDRRIYCGDCGKRMRFVKRQVRNGTRSNYYCCAGFLDSGERTCTRHGMNSIELEDAVFAAIRQQLSLATNIEALLAQLKGSSGERNLQEQFQSEINSISMRLKKVATKREKLYESYVEHILDEQEYLFAKKEYDEEYARISAQLEEARLRKRHFDQAFQSENKWLKTIHLVQGAEEMTPQLVKAVVKAVRVYENKRIEVEFNYEEQRQYLLELAEALADINDEGRCG